MNRRLAITIALILSTPALPTVAQAEVSPSVVAMAKKCAPNVSPLTMGYLVNHESASIPYRLNVNGGHKLPMDPKNETEAREVIRWLQARNYNFDVGYGQVNSANFAGLNVSAENLLDGCNNLRASAVILTACYQQATKTLGEGQDALRQALSCYNTGSPTKGLKNGYVAKVEAQIQPNQQVQVPALVARGEQELANDGKAQGQSDGGSIAAEAQAKRRRGTPDAFSHADGGAFASSEPDAFQGEQDSPETK